MASTKNITMKEYNGVDYDTLYPKTVAEQVIGIYSKDEILSNEVKQLFGYGENAVPNDIFLTLGLGQGQYGYRIIVKLHDGTPVVGATISGIDPLPNANLITNNKGMVLGVSTSQNVTISITSPYIDIDSKSNITITSSSLITNKEVILTAKTEPYILLTETQDVTISPIATFFDTCAVGGGGSGSDLTNTIKSAGGGGGGGSVSNVLKTPIYSIKRISVVVGSGGNFIRGKSGQDGGTTTVKLGENFIAQAEGGKGAPDTVIRSGYGKGGSGGLNGGNGGQGANNELSSADGKPCTANIFNDSSLGLAGSGGGGGGMYWGTRQPLGGAKNGAKGAWHTSNQTPSATTAQVPGGGGGGSVNNGNNGSSGAKGGVYLRFHY